MSFNGVIYETEYGQNHLITSLYEIRSFKNTLYIKVNIIILFLMKNWVNESDIMNDEWLKYW